MFGNCPSKLDCEILLLRFGFWPKQQYLLWNLCIFLNITFAQLPGGKLTYPSEFNFFLYFPAEIFQFNFNPRCRFGWLPGYLDKVYLKIEYSICRLNNWYLEIEYLMCRYSQYLQSKYSIYRSNFYLEIESCIPRSNQYLQIEYSICILNQYLENIYRNPEGKFVWFFKSIKKYQKN